MLNIKLYMDGAEIEQIVSAAYDDKIQGFTTNPTLMKKAGITDYQKFAQEVIAKVPHKPISFEVFSDDLVNMEREARIINSWGGNTFIKIPIMNTKGESTIPLIKTLSAEGFSLNITAVFTLEQVQEIADNITSEARTIVSVFAGRIADTGIDPVPVMQEALQILAANKNAELLWASPRETLNIYQAAECGCHIITATNDILKKLSNAGKDLHEFSRETVQMFYDDAQAAGYKLG